MKQQRSIRSCWTLFTAAVLFVSLSMQSAVADEPLLGTAQINSGPPAETTKLVFVHASIGALWLVDGYGNMGRDLAANNYFVSDYHFANHPELPEHDYCSWPAVFGDPALLNSILQHQAIESGYGRSVADPGGENEIIMIKPCGTQYPIYGNPDDPPSGSHGCPYVPVTSSLWDGTTVGNVKQAMLDALQIFAQHPDKFFVLVSAPANMQEYMTYDENARAVASWMVNDLLDGYEVGNVMVFDLFNVLTSNPEGEGDTCPSTESDSDSELESGNHHRIWNGAIQHQVQYNQNYSAYCDNHPSKGGMRKAASEFVPLLNAQYNAWSQGQSQPKPARTATTITTPTLAPTPTDAPPTSAAPAATATAERTNTPEPTPSPTALPTTAPADTTRDTPAPPTTAQTETATPTRTLAPATATSGEQIARADPTGTAVVSPAPLATAASVPEPSARPAILSIGIGAILMLACVAIVLVWTKTWPGAPGS